MHPLANIRSGIALCALMLASCASHHIRKGDQAYALMAYAKAEHHYDRVPADARTRDMLLRAADACRRQSKIDLAEHGYRTAESMGALVGDDALRFGQVLMGNGHRDEAAALFMRVMEERPEDGIALDLYTSCRGYDHFLKDSASFVVSALDLPGVVNVFGAVPYKHGLLVAAEQEASAAKADSWNGFSYLDLYYCERRTAAAWNAAHALPKAVNSPYHEGPAIISADGRHLYFTRSNYYDRKLGKDVWNTSHLKIFRATLDSLGEWSDIRSFPYNGEDFSVGHPSLSSDGRTLYFASDMPGGQGGSDIWRCLDSGTGWGPPENLGATVNTAGDELFPASHGDALSFSSTAHANMGGLDIFEAHRNGNTWSTPVNLHHPINTRYDDFAFVLDTVMSVESKGRSGYLSSNRDGHDRVYSFRSYDPNIYVDGIVQDEHSRFLPNMTVTLTEVLTDTDVSMTTGPDGAYRFQLKSNVDYVLRAEGTDIITRSQPLSTKGLTRSDTLHAGFQLTRVEIDRPMAVSNIYFDYDSWDLRPSSASEMDKIAQLFKDNPTLSFELSAHTDSRGGDTYNLVLSDARAASAVNYLIQQGCDPDRIRSMGYGETRLVNLCSNGVACTEEEHQANRRVEFKVTGIKNVAQKR